MILINNYIIKKIYYYIINIIEDKHIGSLIRSLFEILNFLLNEFKNL